MGRPTGSVCRLCGALGGTGPNPRRPWRSRALYPHWTRGRRRRYGTEELQRIGPVRGRPGRVLPAEGRSRSCRRRGRTGLTLATVEGAPWLSPLSWRTGCGRPPDRRTIEPYRPHAVRAADGRRLGARGGGLDRPRDAGTQSRRTVEGGCRGRGRGAARRSTGLGAVRAAERVRADLRRRGVSGVPRGPRVSTATNAAGLTARQLEVLRLLAEGLTNVDIAARLTCRTRPSNTTSPRCSTNCRSRPVARRSPRHIG